MTRITIEPTQHEVIIDGQRGLLWEGITATGFPVVVLITRILVGHDRARTNPAQWFETIREEIARQ